MVPLNIPFFMVVAFLLLTLAVGFYFSKKETTLREYAIGNKQFTTAALVATVLATNFSGGGLICAVEHVHNGGLYGAILFISIALGCWFVSILALRIGPFMQHLSMPDTIGKIYGRWPRIIVALSSILAFIAVIAMQISVVSQTLIMCVGIDNPKLVAILATLVLVFYAAFGGVRAVLFTDVLQFITFAIVIPLIGYFLFLRTGKIMSEVVSFVSAKEKFQFTSLLDTTTLLARASFIMSFIVGMIDPSFVQRIYMSSGPIQARSVFRYATLFTFVITCFIISIGVFVFAAAPELPQADVWGYIVAHIPPVFKGFLAISLLAMAMSTADSCLNACSVMIGYDIVESIRGEKKIPYCYSLQIVRLATLGVGVAAVVLVFYTNDLLSLIKLSLNFFVPIVTAPFILAVYGFRGSSRTALIGMATGILTIGVWSTWVEPRTGIDGSCICMVANGLAMLAAHYLLPHPEGSNWVGPDDEFRQLQQAKERKKNVIKQARAHLILPVFVMMAMIVLTGMICALFRFYG